MATNPLATDAFGNKLQSPMSPDDPNYIGDWGVQPGFNQGGYQYRLPDGSLSPVYGRPGSPVDPYNGDPTRAGADPRYAQYQRPQQPVNTGVVPPTTGGMMTSPAAPTVPVPDFGVTNSLFGGTIAMPGVAQGGYVPFSSLLQPYGGRGYGNYGYGPVTGSGVNPPMPQPPLPYPSMPQPQMPAPINPFTPTPRPPTTTPAVPPGFDTILGKFRPTTVPEAQTYQENVAKTVLGNNLSAASTPKADIVKDLYTSIGRTGNLAPSQAEIAFWASQPETGDALRQRFLQSASTFIGDPVYGKQGQAAAGLLSSPSTTTPARDVPKPVETGMGTGQAEVINPGEILNFPGLRTPTSGGSTFTPKPLGNNIEAIKQAFQSIPGANPNPDQATLEYYAQQGVGKLMEDIAFIRATNPALAMQIDAQRAAAGLK